jgi:hypothetical protein
MFISFVKINQLLQSTCIFWILTKILSWKLWLSKRDFPVIPVFDSLNKIPHYVHFALLIVSLVLLFLLVLFPKKKYFIGLILLAEICSCLLDQNRWQPYELHFILIFCFFMFLNETKDIINYVFFLFAATYIFSGLHKINGGFLYFVWENSILRFFLGFQKFQIKSMFIHYLGLILPIFEILGGLGLLFLKNKKWVILALIALHIFVVVWLNPLGLGNNTVVIPWNFAMIAFLLILYSKEFWQFNFKNLFIGYRKIFFIIIAVLPIFSFFNWYDSYLSFNLYSGNNPKMIICTNDKNIPFSYQPFLSKNENCLGYKNSISVENWSLKEMNVFVIPQDRVFKKIALKWVQKNPKLNTNFYVLDYPYKKENARQIFP